MFYNQYLQIEGQNPYMNIGFQTYWDEAKQQCRADINSQVFQNNTSLQNNFTLSFLCDDCTNGYSVSIREVFVNSQGNYENTFETKSDKNFNQTYLYLLPIVLKKTDNRFDVNIEYSSEILISPLTKNVKTNTSDRKEIQILFANTELEI